MHTGFPGARREGLEPETKKTGDASVIGFSVRAIERRVSPEFVCKSRSPPVEPRLGRRHAQAVGLQIAGVRCNGLGEPGLEGQVNSW
jgi:hypothetical protein